MFKFKSKNKDLLKTPRPRLRPRFHGEKNSLSTMLLMYSFKSLYAYKLKNYNLNLASIIVRHSASVKLPLLYVYATIVTLGQNQISHIIINNDKNWPKPRPRPKPRPLLSRPRTRPRPARQVLEAKAKAIVHVLEAKDLSSRTHHW